VDVLESLGKRIKLVRKRLRLTQLEFAQQVNVSKSSVVNYELAKRIPDALFLIKLIEKFNISPDWLMTGKSSLFMEDEQVKHGKVIDDEFKQLQMDFHIPLIRLGVMAEYRRLKEVFKPMVNGYPQEKPETLEGKI